MIMSASAFFALVQDRRVWMIGDFLFRRGEPNLHRLEFIWRTDPRGVIMLGACVLLALIFVIGLLRFFVGLFGALARLGSGPADGVSQANTPTRRKRTTSTTPFSRKGNLYGNKEKTGFSTCLFFIQSAVQTSRFIPLEIERYV